VIVNLCSCIDVVLQEFVNYFGLKIEHIHYELHKHCLYLVKLITLHIIEHTD